MNLKIAFAGPPAAHWAPRLKAGGVNVQIIDPPKVTDDGAVSGMPDPQDGWGILVNARVAGSMKGSGRDDLYCLPQGASQDDSPVDLTFLVKV